MADLSEEELAAAQKHMEECGLGGGNTTWLYYDLRLMLAEIRRLRAALAERDALLAKAGEVLEPFAKADEAISQHDPDFPDHGAALRASFDWFVMWDSGPYTAEAALKRRGCTRGDLRRAASLASELKEKQP